MKAGKTDVQCLEDGCDLMISQREMRTIVGEKLFEKLDRRALEMAISIDSTLHHCPTPDCNYIASWRGPDLDGPP